MNRSEHFGGHPLNYNNWRRNVRLTACENAGLPDLVFHDLRSLTATALMAAHVDVKTAQKRMRHSSAKTTLDIYARATAKASREAAEAVGDYLRPSASARGVHADSAGLRIVEKHPARTGLSCGRRGTRTPDLGRVKAAL